MKDSATVSIALATYNGEPYLRAQLDSYVAQERPPDELVLSDDASTDRTLDIAREFAQGAPFPVRIVANRHAKGYRGNFQTAIEETTGDLIMLSDQDDVWLPGHVARLAEALESGPDVLAAVSNSECVDTDLKPLGYTTWEADRFTDAHRAAIMRGGRDQFGLMVRHRAVSGHAMGFRRSLVPVAQPLSAEWIHDQWIVLLASAFGKVVYVPDSLTQYRQHGSNSVSAASKSLASWAKDTRGQQSGAAEAELAKWSELLHRAVALREGRPAVEPAIALLREKTEFSRFRGEIRKASGLKRAVATTTQLLRGRYHRLGRGFLAYGRDLQGYR